MSAVAGIKEQWLLNSTRSDYSPLMIPAFSSLSIETINQWLKQHRKLVVCLLLFSAISIRGLFVSQVWNSPCAWHHRWEQTDMYLFDLWARKIAAGDILMPKPLHAYSEWLVSAAGEHFCRHPEVREVFQKRASASAGGHDAVSELLDEWSGGLSFHQEPGYAYMIALTYKLFGPDQRHVFILQSIMGILTIILLYLVSLRLFDDLTAVIAAFLSVFHGPLLFYEGILLRDSLITFCTIAFVWVILFCCTPRKPASYLVMGIFSGLALLLKSIFLPLVIILAGCICFANARLTARAFVPVLIFVAGILLSLFPLGVRNIAVGVHPFVITTPFTMAVTFINANAEDSLPGHGFTISRHCNRIISETGCKTIPVIMKTLKTHQSLGSCFSVMWQKWCALWHWYEQPNNENFYYYRLHVPVLAYLPVTFLLLSPLAIIGLLLAAGELRARWPLYLVGLWQLGLLMAGLVISRYRIPFQALLIPFAAWTLAFMLRVLIERRVWLAIGMTAAVTMVASWTGRPLPPSRPLIRCADYSAAYSAYYSPNAQAAIRAGRWDIAAAGMKASLTYEPQVVRTMGSARAAMNNEEAALAELYSQVHGRIGEALKNSGKPDEASAEERRSGELKSAADRFRSQVNPLR